MRSALILLVLAALVYRSDAVRCYSCVTPFTGHCDDIRFTKLYVQVIDCPTREFPACWYGQGDAYGKKTYIFLVENV